MATLELPEIMDTKEAFVRVITEEGNMHIAWRVNGKIIAFEFIPENYPQGGLYIWNSEEEYMNDIPNWVRDAL